MNLRPKHLAAAQYSIVALFLLASWALLLSPADTALDTLRLSFSGHGQRWFFASFAAATAFALLLAASYWSKHPLPKVVSSMQVITSVVLLALAIWQFDTTLVFSLGLGCCFALWSWFTPNTALNRTRKSGAPVS